ncbi:MAG: hypothetical protein A3C84_01715 [Candidatus Ryanbacteria bacterium RIFCSPHIGHO2_02_FULL_48_12]|jgi:hypothetical protein|uniref:Uncharacterized protein n=1 Tax=Candidatus Ryanbacteria bacterium RIFCSPHIGHO2_01_FULL_48_27 TaxID=1802115 RepID=A0A1G2G7I1_9BACT|nr:MAG: hypothetical protein A2756_06450 [Candidatus Ryanbacteria bacterium RIFCSPHIGHO2_01_FULL_48_27]OGZ49197.1 MAG: hypothetical protein A3C84_01715 [Candidatus Ryanbacteria bacterium RIFCSPHIGHO2_02_FULL_48_12]
MKNDLRGRSYAIAITRFYGDPAGIPVLAIPQNRFYLIRQCGEARLLWRVLENGIETYMRYAHTTSRRGRYLFEEAEQWIWADDPAWLCSFVSICNIVGFDPDYIRDGLVRWKNQAYLQTPTQSLDPKHPVPVVVAPLRPADAKAYASAS